MLRSLAGYRAAMARLARIVIPGAPHRVTQRGNRRPAGGADAAGEAVAEAIEARLRTGRPLAAAEWIAQQESATGRRMAPAKRGPKPKAGGI